MDEDKGKRCKNEQYIYSDEVAEVTAKTSPFIYRQNMMCSLNKGRDCSAANIRRLCRNGMLTELHYTILKVLYEYDYLNAFLIRLAVEVASNGELIVPAATGRKAIKTLVGHGLLLQYSFKYIDDVGRQQQSPFIYRLSASGKRLVQKEQGSLLRYLFPRRESEGRTFIIPDVLNRLTVNQFHLTFMKQYGSKEYFQSADFHKIQYKKWVIPGIYRINVPGSSAILSLFVISVRQNEGWKKEFLEQVRAIKEFSIEKRMSGTAILTICETEYQAMEAARSKASDSTLADNDVFYICDCTILDSDTVLSQLIDVLPVQNHTKRRIFSLNLEGNSTVHEMDEKNDNEAEFGQIERGSFENEINYLDPAEDSRKEINEHESSVANESDLRESSEDVTEKLSCNESDGSKRTGQEEVENQYKDKPEFVSASTEIDEAQDKIGQQLSNNSSDEEKFEEEVEWEEEQTQPYSESNDEGEIDIDWETEIDRHLNA